MPTYVYSTRVVTRILVMKLKNGGRQSEGTFFTLPIHISPMYLTKFGMSLVVVVVF